MEFRFEGYIREIGPLETILFADGSQNKKCEVIVTTDERIPNSFGISFWNDDAVRIANAVPKQYVSIDYNAKADFVQGKKGIFLKNNLKAWRYQLGQVNPNLQWAEATIPAYQPAPAAPAAAATPPQQATIPAYQPAAAAAPRQVAAAQQAVPQQIPLQVNGLPNPVMLTPNQAPF